MRHGVFPTRRMASLMRGPLVVVIGLLWTMGLLLAVPSSAVAVNGQAHVRITSAAVDALIDVDTDAAVKLFDGRDGGMICQELPDTPFRHPRRYFGGPGQAPQRRLRQWAEYPGMGNYPKLLWEVRAVDWYRDLEFVDVDGERDNPHTDTIWEDNDDPHKKEQGRPLTAYCHFIDIKKGPGLFDDYDGYAYHKGSASRDQYQPASEVAENWFAGTYADIRGFKVDQGIQWWFDDEYVHAPGQPWYREGACSPALERYSFPSDMGAHASIEDECVARFPRAFSSGAPDRGYPASVFPPVDNMARFWFEQFTRTNDVVCLGPVLHAIQDASVPHHAAGYLGNWHDRYEASCDGLVGGLIDNDDFKNEVRDLVKEWGDVRPFPTLPAFPLRQDQWNIEPSIAWPVEQLVTWVALNAYHEYEATYDHFRGGNSFNATSARRLTVLATAMSALVLRKAARPGLSEPPQPRIIEGPFRIPGPPGPPGPLPPGPR